MDETLPASPVSPENPPAGRPTVTMAVVMCKVPLANRWQPWKWELDAVLPDLGEYGAAPLRLDADSHGARWLDAGESVENVPLAPAQREWLEAFTHENYRPEPKKRRRPESFKAPEDRARY